jgi:hypothetical protein
VFYYPFEALVPAFTASHFAKDLQTQFVCEEEIDIRLTKQDALELGLFGFHAEERIVAVEADDFYMLRRFASLWSKQEKLPHEPCEDMEMILPYLVLQIQSTAMNGSKTASNELNSVINFATLTRVAAARAGRLACKD